MASPLKGRTRGRIEQGLAKLGWDRGTEAGLLLFFSFVFCDSLNGSAVEKPWHGTCRGERPEIDVVGPGGSSSTRRTTGMTSVCKAGDYQSTFVKA